MPSPSGAKHAPPADTVVYYNHADWLGTERARTNLSGTVCESISSLPFGDDQTITSTCGDLSPMHFTGKQRDTESGLDYFGARYYESTMGRWLSPDWSAKEEPVPYAKLNDPQTLNLYSYVQNNPLSRFDDDGHGTNYIVLDANYGKNKNPNDWPYAVAGMATTAAAIFAPEAVSSVLFRNLLGLGLRSAPTALPIIGGIVEGLTPGAPGSLTIASETRLSVTEIDTGARFAKQEGLSLVESAHIGEEFKDTAGKTYDAMGGGKAFEHFGDGSSFFQSIVNHTNKSVDSVIVDLKGASKDQVSAVKAFVGTLTKQQQGKIRYAQ